MDTIKKILSDFYYCTNLGIQFLDADLTLIDSMGHVSTILPEIVTENLSPNTTTELVTNCTNHFLVLLFNQAAQKKGYFIIGAYQTKDEGNTEIPFKPIHLAQYFEEILISIIKKNIVGKVESNPHVAKGIEYIHKNYHQSINLHLLSEYLNLNTCYFCVLFKNHTNLTFNQYLNKIRINESKKMLETTNNSIIDISLAVGFNNHNHFSATFKKLNGMTPTAYRNQIKK